MTFSQTRTLNLLPAFVIAVVISFSACKNYDTVDDVKVTPPTPTTAPMNNSVSNVDSVGMMNGSTSGGSAAITNAVADSAGKANLRTDSIPRKKQ